MTYACCFCGEAILRDDAAAVRLSVTSLWHSSPAAQDLQAHSACASRAINAEPFDPDVLIG
jgi:hypothetical protein